MCVLAAASNIGNERPAVRQGSFGGQTGAASNQTSNLLPFEAHQAKLGGEIEPA